MKKRTKRQIAGLCVMSMAISTFAGIFMGSKAYADTWPDIGSAKIKSAQPHFSGYSVRNIETWDKETDPFSDLMRARVPLQKRNEAFTQTQANPSLNDKTEVMLMQGDYGNSFFNSTIANNSYGNVAFNFWQYTDYFCPWHGAATIGVPEGLYDPVTSDWHARGFEFGIVNIPNQAYINAAHKNGVKAIACIYFDPAFRPGQTINEMFVKDTNGDYVVAKKLIALAKEYGIDGYFLNNEEGYDGRFKDFMAYLSEKGLYTQFYDTNSSFDKYKSEWLKDDKHAKIHDSVFVNYGWSNVNKFVEHAKEIGVDPYKAVFLGIEANQGKYIANNNLVKDSYTSEADKNPLCSIALFTPSDMYQRGVDDLEGKLGLKGKLPVHQRPEYQWMVAERERMYFSGVTCDPKDTGSHPGYKREDVVVNNASYWPGVADFKAETSVIRGKKFYTDFNIGKGMQYFAGGKAVNDEAWTNLNDQDILPSWQWWFESKGSKLKADFDFGEKEVRNDINGNKRKLPFTQIGAYNGGSSLVVYGDLKSKNNLKLFKTALDVTESTKAKLVFRKTSDDDAKMKLGLVFEDKAEETVELEIKNTETKSNEFKQAEVDLSAYKGKKIAAISLVFDGNADTYQMNIGRISVSDTENEIKAPENFKIDRVYDDKQMVLSWKLDKYEDVDKYRVYAESEGEKHFLGGIYDEKLYVKDYFFDKGKEIKFSLVKVGKDGKESKAAEKVIDFSKLPTEIKVAENIPEKKFNERVVKLHAEAETPEKISFSFKKGKDNESLYEASVEPIREYTDDKTLSEYKVDVAADNGVVSVPNLKDGYFYDLTIKPKNSEIGISYRGKFNDSYARPMTEDDIVWAGVKHVALRSPLTRDWYEVKIGFKTEGEAEAKEIGGYQRGVTPNYHNRITLPSDKGEIILTLNDYKGNSSEIKLKYDESYKEELVNLKDEYSKIVNNRSIAKILYDNHNLDEILDEMQSKINESEQVINTLKRNEEKVINLVKELKEIYGKLHRNENAIKCDIHLVIAGYAQVNFTLKDKDGTKIEPLSSKNNLYSFILAKGKEYNYKVSNTASWGTQIIPKEGSFVANEDGKKIEITVEKAAKSIEVVPKEDNTIKRLGSLNRENYDVKVKYSLWEEDTIPLTNESFTVEEPDTSTLGEKTVKVTGLNKETTFKAMVIPNDTDPNEIKELWSEIVKARGLKEKAEYKYATIEKKNAFDEALVAAEELITGSEFDVKVISEKLEKLKEAVKALDGLSNEPLTAVPSAAKSVDPEYKLEKMVDGKNDTYAWITSPQIAGDWVKLTYTKQIKVNKVKIIYPADLEDDFIKKADIEVKDGDSWKKIGEITGTEKTTVEIEAGKEPVTTEVQIKITEASDNWYKIAEFLVEYEEVKAPKPQPDPEVEALKKTLEKIIAKAEALKADVKYKKADKEKQEEFDEVLDIAKKILQEDDVDKEALEEAISQLKTAAEALNGKEESAPTPPAITYPVVPAVPDKKEEGKEESKKADVNQEDKKNEKTTPSITDITDTKTPQGTATEKKSLILPSTKKKVDLAALKGLDTTTAKKIILPQNKAKINVSITATALSEMMSKKISTFEIRGKNFNVYLNVKNIKALNKFVEKQFTLKATKLKTGKIKIQIFADGRKLTTKELAKLKIKVK